MGNDDTGTHHVDPESAPDAVLREDTGGLAGPHHHLEHLLGSPPMYAKVFAQIFDSSIAENPKLRHIFMDLLVLADPEGMVRMTQEAIARRTNMPLEDIVVAIEKLSEPDTRSQSTKEGGRRLVLLDADRDWGWQIVNFKDYHDMKDEEARRAYMREYMRERRAGEKERKQAVNSGKQGLAHPDVDVDSDLNADSDKDTPPTPQRGNGSEGDEAASTATAASKVPPVPYADVLNEWNMQAIAHGFRKSLRMSPKLKSMLSTRWRTEFWRERWRDAVRLVHTRPFNLGENDRGWKADLEWFLRPGQIDKILERGDDGRPKPTGLEAIL